MTKALDPIIAYAAQNGWTVRRFTRKNTAIYAKDGCQQVSVSLFPHDRRAVDNMLSRMRVEDRALAAKNSNTTQ